MIIPYRVSAEISGIVPFPFQFYEAVWDVLIGMDGLGLSLQFHFAVEKEKREKLSPKAKKKKEKDDPLPNPQAAYCVLRHVVFRTIQFRKIMEFVRVLEIMEGMPTIGIAGAPFQERAVKYALKYLVKIGALLKINLPKTKAVTAMYGLNLLDFLFFLDHYWKEAIKNLTNNYDYDAELGSMAKSIKALRAQKLLSVLIQYTKKFKPVFNHIEKMKTPITNLGSFCKKVRTSCPDNQEHACFELDLIEGIRNARIRGAGAVGSK